MKQNFTPDHLLKFLYKETSASETLAISEALHSDPKLRRELEALQQAQHQLPRVKFNPSASTIQRILKYSERTAVSPQA